MCTKLSCLSSTSDLFCYNTNLVFSLVYAFPHPSYQRDSGHKARIQCEEAAALRVLVPEGQVKHVKGHEGSVILIGEKIPSPSCKPSKSPCQDLRTEFSTPPTPATSYQSNEFKPETLPSKCKGNNDLRKLDSGRYLTVWLVQNTKERNFRALKTLSTECYRGLKNTYNCEILEHLQDADPSHPGYTYISTLVDSFEHHIPMTLIGLAVGQACSSMSTLPRSATGAAAHDTKQAPWNTWALRLYSMWTTPIVMILSLSYILQPLNTMLMVAESSISFSEMIMTLGSGN
ncbi:conserved hypothetical protein [Coccidioides posadasii str. Silveira]|uniref:Uncharacterized protein n=1 Tax=Coccidioides posadasii (strain RMSCC 757 / Silveira) TaxID=443226 RepID=E9D547_COCPS|nr:conserved hypothetical protein [Coccidioides posadasii str. Silveira]